MFAFARIRMLERPGPIAFAVLVPTVFLLAYLTWRFVETPFRNRARVPTKTLVGVGLGGSLALIAAGLKAALSGGFPDRIDTRTKALIDTAEYSPKREACHTRGSDFLDPRKACVYFNDNVTCVALGDSHAIEPAYALAEQLATRNQGLVHRSFSGCPPALSVKVDVSGCTA